MLLEIIRSDLLLAYRRRSEIISPLIFFIVVVSLFALTLDPTTIALQHMAPGIIWVAALLSVLLSFEYLFRREFEEGSLIDILLSPYSTNRLVLAKIFTHWLVTGLPLLLITPVAALFLSLPSTALPALLASLALGTPILSGMGAIGVALTVGLRRSGVLLALLTLPLFTPVLIFGTAASQFAMQGLPISGQLSLLAALLILVITLVPFAVVAALKISMDE
jgi:heme exporter protein B